ncbi:MAG: hypothetical protein V1911_01370 [Candidatus Micrarchaeota archaeon]
MVCYLMFKKLVQDLLKDYNVNEQEAVEILQDIEKEVGHNKELIKAIVDFEGENLIKRLKKKRKEKKEEREIEASAGYA